MPVITLPDGSKREFDQPVTLMQVAEDIGLVSPKRPYVVVLTVNWSMPVS